MLGRLVILVAISAAGSISASPAEAWRWSHHTINATPFFHSPCSVLRRTAVHAVFLQRAQPRAVHSREISDPYGENLQLTIETVPPEDEKARYARPDHDLDSIADLFAELRSCWSPPPAESAQAGMQMTVRFSFKRGRRHHRHAAPDLCDRGCLVRSPRYLSESDQRLARCLHAAEVHQRSRRGTCRQTDRDPLCRQSRIKTLG